MIIFFSCQDEEILNPSFSDETSLELELTQSIAYIDGVRTTVYSEKPSGKFMVLNGDDYVDLSTFYDNEQLVYYINGELKDFLIFTSKDKMKSFIENPVQYSELLDRIKALDPLMIKEVDKGATADASGPSFTIATAHSLGGYTFTKSFSYLYVNPHLRCNQYETNCINFNDEISSFKVTNAYIEFYPGSFSNTGGLVFADARGTTIQANYLHEWNDVITSFWATSSSEEDVPSIALNIWSDYLYNCPHDYSDPACGSGGGGGPGPGNGGIQ